ncbi:MAG: outer membrane beta-barrel protein [Bacteroidia bacterium]
MFFYKNLLLLLICVCTVFINTYAQTDSLSIYEDDERIATPDPDPDTKVGIKMGIMLSGIYGTENSNSIATFGLNGGGYLRQKLTPKSWLQTELFISFRGSNFKAVTQEYEKIRLLYIDLPVLYMRAFKNTENKWFAGVQSSYMVNQNMYLAGQQLPLSAGLNLNKLDILPVLGYQYQMTFLAFQTCVKYGLMNINSGKAWPQSARPMNSGGTMHNAILELNLIF